MRRRRLCLALLIGLLGLGALLYRLSTGYGCGPFSEIAYFTYSLHPDFPLDHYARGELGILQPSYARSYLYVAYRYLSGRSFDSDEQKALLALWQERLARGTWGFGQNEAVKRWIEARKRVPGAGTDPFVEIYRDFGKNFQQYINCTDDSFLTAIHTLDQRIARFGETSDTVREWLHAQDQVFSNCNGKPPGFQPGSDNPSLLETIPAALESSAPPLLHADREYQIAAAYFYSAKFDEAQKRFERIAQDSTSPWRQIARLLVARCLIREATLNAEPGEFGRGSLVQAEGQLSKLLDDPNLGELQPSAQRLLNFVEIRLHPSEAEHHLAASLLHEHIGSAVKQSLWDYTLLIDKLVPDDRAKDADETKTPEQRAAAFAETLEARRKDELSDWILTFQGTSHDALDHSLERWTKTQSLPWLVAALSMVHAEQPEVPELLKAADGVKPGSPGFASVAFHRSRLLSEANQNNEARAVQDKLLSEQRNAFPPSSLNLLLALRMNVASNLDEFLKFAQRVPASLGLDVDAQELPEDLSAPEGAAKSSPREPVRFDADSTRILNRILPLEILAQAAENKALSDDLRGQVVQAAWVKSILLDDTSVSLRLVPVWEALQPELKDILEAYRAEKSPESGRFAAVFMMLKFPGMRPIVYSGVSRKTPLNKIDSYRDNWWCVPQADADQGVGNVTDGLPDVSGPSRLLYPAGEPPSPAFLHAEQKTKGQQEWKRVRALGVAPNYFAREVVAFGKQHPDDPRVPEALYLAIRSTRYGCTDKETGKLSKAAFEFLHARYPSSEWAKRTKFWFGN